MSDLPLVPSDQIPPPPLPIDSVSQEMPQRASDAGDAPPLLQEPPSEEWVVDEDVFQDEHMSDQMAFAKKLAAQIERDSALIRNFTSINRNTLQGMQYAMRFANVIPPIPPHVTNPLVDMGRIAENVVIGQIKPTLQVLSLTASSGASVLAESMRSSAPLAFEPPWAAGAMRSIADLAFLNMRSVVVGSMRLNALTPPFAGLLLPEFNILNSLSFPPVSALLSDMRWLDTLTGSFNTLLANLPDWKFFKGLKDKTKQRLLAAFGAIKMCFAPSMSEELPYRVADILESTGEPSVAADLVWNYYAQDDHRRLRQTVDGWQKTPVYVQLWKHFLEPGLRHHINGDYSSSICVLAPRIEGIASHIVQRNALLPAKKPKRGKLGLGITEDVILRALGEIGDASHIDDEAVSIGQWVRMKSLIDCIKGEFCQHHDFEGDYDLLHFKAQFLNRHGMLHGIQTEGFTGLNSLRLFLLLDTIHGLLKNYIAVGGKV